jgi:hypothetical protein
MSSLAADLISDSHCEQDYNQGNPLVTRAYDGLLAYEPMYRATCLKNPDTQSYCFSDAISNTANPTDFYPYLTGVGMTLPESANPSCTKCLKDTMSIFARYATSAGQPLAKTYLGCANKVDSSCGAGFADLGIKVGSVKQGGGDKNGAGSFSLTLSKYTTCIVGIIAGVLTWTA